MALKPVLAYVALLSLISITKAINTGFTTDLIHRDSLQSPLHNPSLSPLQRRLDAIRRSFHRVRRYNSKQSPAPQITTSDGDYLMKYSLGTPPVPSIGIADTGSDIIWTQCPPCLGCFNQSFPIFQPKNSSTYKRIPCISPTCTSLVNITFCSKSVQNCLYAEGFGDGSFTQGELSTDTISFPSASGEAVIFRAPNVVFGCGFLNGGMYFGGESGIVGLGGGNLSLVRQLGEGLFSYCLVKQSETDEIGSGRINFGAKARVSGELVVSTPLVTEDPSTFYFLTLEGISVGNRKVGLDNPLSADVSKEGNMIIDSGTVLTYLPKSFYDILAKVMISSIELKRVKDPLGELDLCFFTRSDDIEIPRVVFNFKGGNVNLGRDNVFVRTGDVSLCLAVVPVSDQEIGVYGNLAQINFLVGYDLEKRAVFFKPADCSKY